MSGDSRSSADNGNAESSGNADGMAPSGVPSLSLPCSEHGHRRAVVVVTHADDSGATAAMSCWQNLSLAGLLRPVAHDCVGAAPSSAVHAGDGDTLPAVAVLADGAWTVVGLSEALSEVGWLARIDVVLACTSAMPERARHEAVEGLDARHRSLEAHAPATTAVRSHLLWIPDWGTPSLTPPRSLLVDNATSTLVALPYDQSDERSMPVPVTSPAPHDVTHGWHTAVEAASAAGLWAMMVGSPLDEHVQFAPDGAGGAQVRLVRSWTRVAAARMPSPERTLRTDGLLPLPAGTLPAPDARAAVAAAAPNVLPDAFRLSRSARHGPATAGVAHSAEFRALLQGSMAADAEQRAPGQIDDAVRGYDETVAASADLDDFVAAVRARAPWVEPLTRLHGPTGDSSPTGAARVQDDSDGDGPDPATASGAVASDASDISDAAASAETSDAPWPRIIPGQSAPELSAAARAAEERLNRDLPSVSLRDAVPSAAWDDLIRNFLAVADGAETAAGRADAPDEAFVVLDRHALVAAPVRGGPSATAAEIYRSATEKDSPTLASELSREFDAETVRCRQRVTDTTQMLGRHLSTGKRPTPGVVPFIPQALIAAALIGIGALLTLTAVRETVTPDRLSGATRVMLFGFATLAAAAPLILTLISCRSMRAQTRLTLVAGGFAAAAAATAVMSDQIHRSSLDRRGFWLPAVLVIVCFVVLAVTARVRGFRGDEELLGPLWPLVTPTAVNVSVLLYVWGLAVAGLNYDMTAPAAFEERSWRLLVVLLSAAAAVLFTAAGLRHLVRNKDRREVREWRVDLVGLVEQCEEYSVRADIMTHLRNHWLVTAATLATLIHRPFGTPPAAGSALPPTSGLRKAQFREFDAAESTRDAFNGELLPRLAPRGWLNARYRSMTDRFLGAEEARLGIRGRERLPVPEHCTHPMASVRPATEGSRRWQFAVDVCGGVHDRFLADQADAANAAALHAAFARGASEIVDDASPTAGNSRRGTIPEVLGELLPDPETLPRFPAAWLPPHPAGGPPFETLMWWPEDVPAPELPDSTRPQPPTPTTRLSDRLMFQAIRIDVSQPLNTSRLGPSDAAITAASAEAADDHMSSGSDDASDAKAAPTRPHGSWML